MLTRDKYGILGQIQPAGWVEGGDSVAWMGHFLYLQEDPEGSVPDDKWGWDLDKYVHTFEVGFGGYVRHPDPALTYNGFGAYYKNPWTGCISRDQMTGYLGALIKHGKAGPILRHLAHRACNLFLFSYKSIHNGADPKTAPRKFPDLTFMDIWAMDLRALGRLLGPLELLLRPVLEILDIHMLLNTVLFQNNEPESETDAISFTMKLLTSQEYSPTLVSKLTWKLSKKDKLLRQLKAYWCGWRQNCGMFDLFEARIKKLS